MGRGDMRNIRIGQRLALCFAGLMLLMFLGSLLVLWQVDSMRSQAERVHQVGIQSGVLGEAYAQVLAQVGGESLGQGVMRLMQDVRQEIAQEQAQALESIRQAQQWAVWSVILTGLLTLLAALALGYLVTRSVTGPLKELGRGAQALARGEFDPQIPEAGRDELAELSRVFNHTAGRLKDLYQQTLDREARFRAVIDNTPAVVYIKDAQGRYLLANPRFQELFHVTPEQLSGKTDFDIFPAEAALSFQANDRRVLQSGRAMEVEEKAPHDGEMHTYISAKVPLPGPDGRPYAVCGISTDITEHLRAEEALRESEAKYRLLADNVTDVIWVLEIPGMTFSYVSPSVWRQRGYTAEEAMAQTLAQALTPASLELAAQVMAEELEREQAGGVDPARTRTLELENLCAGGSTIWTEATCSFMRDQSGQPTAVIGVSRDISERRRTQEELRQSQERYRRILEASPDPVVLYDMEGRVLYVSPAFTRVFGWTQEELAGRQINYVPEEEWPETVKRVQQIKQGESFSGWETRRNDKWGNILEVSMSSAVWRDHEGRPAGSVIVLQDLTERKKMAAQLEQARKMEAIGNLAGGIAHDFNNVLHAVSGNVQLLLLKPELDEACRSCLADIDNLVGRAAEMIQQLLTLSRKRVERRELVAVNQEIRQVSRLLERIIPRMISLELELAADLRSIQGDPVQMEQIILNLASNAVDAMPGGGRLILRTENLDLDEMFCRSHPQLKPGPHVLIKVTDTGRGMDRATLERMFEPFFTTKPPGKGTGLGLSTVYGIVKGHEGLITCYSSPGQGTVFNIYLPALAGAAAGEPAAVEAEQGLRGGSETILLVDDEPAILGVGREILQMHGYRVLAADSGEQALEVYQGQTGGVDLVILDLGMPGMGGQRCLERLLELAPQARVIISSGYTTESTVRELQGAGAAGFIAKPYRLSDMVRTVRRILDQGA